MQRQPEEDLEDLRKKFHLLEGDRKVFYHASSMAKQRNREQIQQLQKENKELREQLKAKALTTSGQSMTSTGTDFGTKTEKDLAVWRRKLDEAKNKTLQKKENLLHLQDKQRELNKEQLDINSDDNPQMRTIRMLENRLDKAMIKYNEAMSIKKTYELIVKRLKDERVGYDNQLAAIEQSLKGKEHDFEELLLLSHDANHAKELAEADLRKFESQIEARRKLRFKEVNEQKAQIESRLDQRDKNDKKDRGDTVKFSGQVGVGNLGDNNRPGDTNGGGFGSMLAGLSGKKGAATAGKFDGTASGSGGIDKHRLEDYDEAMRRIKDATGVSDVNEIIQKFATQHDTYNNLLELKSANEKKLMDLNDRKLELRSEVEKMRYEGLEGMTRKQMDEVEKNVNSAQLKYNSNKEKLERINKILVNAKAGIEHLSEKLNDIKLEGVPNVVVTDNTLVEALIQCEQKLEFIFGLVRNDPLYEEAISKIRGLKKDDQELVPEAIGSRLISQSLMMTGFGNNNGATLSQDPTANNIRVKLPDKDDDDLSEADNEVEKEMEANERMKIKLEAQLRYDRMAKNKMKGKVSGLSNQTSTGNLQSSQKKLR
ncbi:UNKNOWN [Stylonychia lemnae]|uniref:ODAD1 central coiled coil region domain-containing protein n=1 Tax=Stylonychia lemnae TaxID=5949 RepID=A0A078AEN5_STYLE|nr:UNKNOWN [Stylonychia lemnae]|eukprot:CDW80685.1 UNKNOWN [Stylonychia lemnae]